MSPLSLKASFPVLSLFSSQPRALLAFSDFLTASVLAISLMLLSSCGFYWAQNLDFLGAISSWLLNNAHFGGLGWV